jgi:hypothetical protein
MERMMSPQEYRTIVTRQHGRRPPCVKCGDRDVSRCMKTGFECREFTTYVGVPMPKKMQRCLSDSPDRDKAVPSRCRVCG